MSCEQLRDCFVPYLLGELPVEETLSVETHLAAGCPQCARDFQATREALELAFEAVPPVPISQDQKDRLIRQALQAQPPASNSVSAQVAILPESEFQLRDALQPVRLIQALLSVAAGFALMLVGESLWLGGSAPQVAPSPLVAEAAEQAPGLGQSLSGHNDSLLSDAQKTVRFVSLTKQPTQPVLTGYFLADGFSQQLHIIGSINRPPQAGETFQLSMLTAETESLFAIALDDQGGFKLIVPLPQQAIREISLLSSSAH